MQGVLGFGDGDMLSYLANALATTGISSSQLATLIISFSVHGINSQNTH